MISSSYIIMFTRWVVLVGLLEGLHSNLSSRGDVWHVAIDCCIHAEVVVFVKATACLDDGQALVPRVKQHLSMTTELGTWLHNKSADQSTVPTLHQVHNEASFVDKGDKKLCSPKQTHLQLVPIKEGR